MACLDKEDLAGKHVATVREEFYRSYDILNIDTKFSMMRGVSVLELTLIVVMLEMSELFPEQPFNFDLILNAYYKFCQKRNWGQQKYEKQIVLKVNGCVKFKKLVFKCMFCLKAYEHLMSLNFVLPANDYGSGGGVSRSVKVSKEHALMYLALDKEEIEQCLDKYANCPTELRYHAQLI